MFQLVEVKITSTNLYSKIGQKMKILYIIIVILSITSCMNRFDKRSIHKSSLESLIINTYYLNNGLLYPEILEVPFYIYNISNHDSTLIIASVNDLYKKVELNMNILNDSMKIHACARKMAEGKLEVDSLTFLDLSKQKLKSNNFVDSIYASGGVKALLQHYVTPNNFIFEFTSFEEGFSTIGTTKNSNDAVKLFKFGADNTGVEWKLEVYSNEGNSTFAIGTDHHSKSVGSVVGINIDKTQLGDKKVDIHSHPSAETQGASVADQKSVDAPYNAVYFKKDGTLHEYNRKSNNLNSIQINTPKDLEEYLKSILAK